jgi:hypothetical protein
MKTHRYTPDEIQFLNENIDSYTNAELAQLLKDKFGAAVTSASVGYALHSRGIKRSKIHTYTEEQINWLQENIKGRRQSEVAEDFNARFGLNLSFMQIRGAMHNRKMTNGLDCKFKPGEVSHRPPKGVHYSRKTEFKKGHLPINHKPVGSERVNVYGYVEVKVAEPNKWRQKHHVVWEQAHGPIPPNHVILFADGNGQNIELDNLVLISRRQLAVLNKQHLLHEIRDRQITKAALLTADVVMKLTQIKKKKA